MLLGRSEQAIRRKGSGVLQFLDCCLRCVQFLWPHELHARISSIWRQNTQVVYLKSWRIKGYWRRPLRKVCDSSQVTMLLPHRTDWACILTQCPSNVYISRPCWAAASYSCKSRLPTRPHTTALQLLVWCGNCIWGACKQTGNSCYFFIKTVHGLGFRLVD